MLRAHLHHSIWPISTFGPSKKKNLNYSCGSYTHLIPLLEHFILYSFELVSIFFSLAPLRLNRFSSLVAYLSLGITQWRSLICIRNTLAQQLMKFSLRLFDFSPLWCDECFSFCPSLWFCIREKIFHLLISFYFYFFLSYRMLRPS